ncbi:TPA: flap endonuclease [bacterium]|nr:flap endonuclease [bacterium]
MESLLIVDGSNLLFQMFYGIPRKIYNAKGETIHGSIGFIGALLKIIRLINPKYICVIFDGDVPLERTKLDQDYKANRTVDWSLLPSDEVPFFEIEKIRYVLDNIKIFNYETITMEADDMISSITHQFHDNFKIYIVSFDSDFFQLINDNVSIIRYRGKNTQIYNKSFFIEKFGFTPDKYLSYKALVGDSSDNIKGIEKIGPKRATYLVTNFENYEDIVNNIEKVKPACIQDSLLNQYERYKLNLKLISLNNIKANNFDIKDFTYDENCINHTSTSLLKTLGIFN